MDEKIRILHDLKAEALCEGKRHPREIFRGARRDRENQKIALSSFA